MRAERPEEDVRIDTGYLFAAVRRRIVRIILVTVGLLAATYLVLMFVPKMYESSASILVEPRDSTFLRATDQAASARRGNDDSSVASEIELIKSRDTLLYVIDTIGLRSEPELNGSAQSVLAMALQLFGMRGEPENLDGVVLAKVESRLTVIQERDSRILTILFRSGSPELSARVANAVAEAHVNRRAGLVISDTADATRWLETEIDKMRTRVAEAEGRVAAYRIENDLFVGSNNTSLLDQQLSDIATQITSAQERKSTAESRAAVLRGLLTAGQPIEGVAAVRDSQTIRQLVEERGRRQSERAQRSATLLPNHPEVQTLTSQIREIDSQIASEGRRVAEALDAEARIESDIEQTLRAELARLKLDASGAARSSVSLNELEREAKAQRDLLETYLLRYRDASARTESNSALPDVRVVSLAAPSFDPVSPKTSLILIAVFVVSVAGQMGLILSAELASGRALVELRPYADAPAAVHRRAVAPAVAPVVPAPGTEWSTGRDIEPGWAPVAPGTIAREPDVADLQPQAPAGASAAYADIHAVASPFVAAPLLHPDARADREDQLLAHQAAERQEAARAEAARAEAARAEAARAEAARAESARIEAERLRAGRQELERQQAERRHAEQLNDERLQAVAAAPAPEPARPHQVPSASDPARQEPSYAGASAPVAAPPAVRQPASNVSPPKEIRDLVEALTIGRERIVYITTLGDEAESRAAVDLLTEEVIRRGLSVAIVDASSGRLGSEPGLTDLCAGKAGFGDVVYRGRRSNTARVPWGQLPRLDLRSMMAVTLAEALTDIYEVVLITVGRPGVASSLPLFAGVDGHVLVASSFDVDEGVRAGIAADAAMLGFERVQVACLEGVEEKVA